MKVKGYNPKTKEAYGKTFVDIGVSILKSTFLIVIVGPMTLFLKSLLDEKKSLWELLSTVATADNFWIWAVLCAFSLGTGTWLRNRGLQIMNEVEEKINKS